MVATVLVHIALLAYAAAAAIYLTWLVRPRDWLVPAGRLLLFAGLVLHLASFGAAVSLSNGEGLARAGFGSDAWKGGQLFSLLAAATVAGYLVLDFQYRLPVAGAFVAPVTVAVMVPAHLVHSGSRAIAPALTHSTALALHVGSAAAGTAALALAFALSLLYLASEKQLKSKHPGKLFARLPSLDLIDRVGWHLSVWGFIFLSIAIATGSLVSRESSGSAFPFAPKQGFAILAWALLAALIQARLVAGWRGRRVALLVVAGFLLLIGTYAGLLTAPPHASSSTAAILFWTGRS
jgi:ABC-type uncharacterized transport system permease subunit